MIEQIKSIHRIIHLALESSRKRDLYKLLVSLIAQIFLSLADLLGVLILGILSSRILNEYLGTSRSQSGPLYELESTLNLENLKSIQMASLVVIIFLLKSIASLFLSWKLYDLLAKCANSASNSFIDNFLETPFVWVRKMDNQKLPFAFMEGINAFSIGVLGNVILLLADLSMIIIMLIGLAQLSLIATVMVIALFGLLTYLLFRLITPKIKSIGNLGTALSIQGRNAILDIKELFQEFPDRSKSKYFEMKAREIRSASSKNYAREQWYSGLPKNLMETAGIIGIFLILLIASILGPTESNVGLVTAFLAATSRIIPALLRIQSNWLSINRNVGYVEQALPVLMRVSEAADKVSRFKTVVPDRNKETHRTGGLTFREVAFKYPDADKNTLQNISFVAKPGEKVAILGDSGSGKTTLSNLILGLLDASSGVIDYEHARSSVFNQSLSETGYLPQKPYIFSGTIFENISLTNDDSLVDMDRYAKAIGQSRISEFIDNLHNGDKTIVGYDGISLSGGESQRIALARVLYLNPPLIVLDEPTSSLDSHTDDFVSQTLTSSALQNTVFIVAHKYKTVRNVDRIIYLENGKIAGNGSWDEIMMTIPHFALQAKLQGIE